MRWVSLRYRLKTMFAATANLRSSRSIKQEGEIVEHVAGRDDVGEFDGVEQHRFAVDQRDVAEMKVAVNAADEATPAALSQQAARCAS